METKIYYSVSEINNIIKEIFDNLPFLRNISLKGEVSNCRGKNKSGHLYFSLKDQKSTISAVMFKFDTLSLDFMPKDGDEVIVQGSISCYANGGTYQIICKSIKLAGQGDLLLKKEMLKQKLYKEGLFDVTHKKEIPSYPEKIAIITGKNSAAAKDFEFNINRRFPLAHIKIFYSLVQGEEAPRDLIKHIDDAISYNPDLIIIGRGGGSLEDLSAFDDESLVRKIYECPLPIISAVGHEINLSLCDLVADKHASTPTGAAELAVPNILDVIDDIDHYESYLLSLIRNTISELETKLLKLAGSDTLKSVSNIFDKYINKIEEYEKKIDYSMKLRIQSLSNNLEKMEQSLKLLNPSSIVNKGFSIIYNKEGKVVKSIKDLELNSELIIKVSDGTIRSIIKEVNENGEKRN